MPKRIFLRSLVLLGLVSASAGVHAQLPWSDETHQIAFGDFNGDGRTDLLYIARDSQQSSGIALSNGAGPYVISQTWASNHLGIAWHGGVYKPIVADFNGDGKADILLQRQSQGDHYLLHANAQGQITAINQTIPFNQGGQIWSVDAHRIVAGDFNGDGKADLFLQAVHTSSLNAVFLAGTGGTFGGPQQTWGNTHIGFQWALSKAVVHAGDFNGDGKADLFIQARPDIVIIDYEIPFPVPFYRLGSFGVADAKAANGNGEIFYTPALQIWDRNHLGVDWSAAASNIIVGDFNGDGRADLFLQSKRAGSLNSLLHASGSGQFTTSNELIDNTLLNASGDQYTLHAANIGGTPASAIYIQANTGAGASSIAWNGAVSLGTETVVYSYDAKGRLTTVVRTGTVNNNVTTTYSHDKANNRTSVIRTTPP